MKIQTVRCALIGVLGSVLLTQTAYASPPLNTAASVQQNIVSASSPEGFRKAWNTAAQERFPDAVIPALTTDRNGYYKVPLGPHVYLAGTFALGSGMSADILLDHTAPSVREARSILLPYWNILISAVDPTLSEASRMKILKQLGAWKATDACLRAYQPSAASVRVGSVVYRLGYANGLVLRVELGHPALSADSRLDWEFKSIFLPGKTGAPIPAQAMDDALRTIHNPAPPSTELLAGNAALRLKWFQSLADWTAAVLNIPSRYQQTDFQPLFDPRGIGHLRSEMEQYYTPAEAQRLLTDEAWGNLDDGVVRQGALTSPRIRQWLYGGGRMIYLPEPPFQEGQSWYYQFPLDNDLSFYRLGLFSRASHSKTIRLTQTPGHVVWDVRMLIGQEGPATEQTVRFTFSLQQSGNRIRISDLNESVITDSHE